MSREKISRKMTAAQFSIVMLYTLGMFAGQVLFKLSASRVPTTGTMPTRLYTLATAPSFIAAMALYLTLSVAWVWVLTKMPMSKAYPVVALNFLLTAAAGAYLWNERVATLNWIGLVLIVVGVALSVR